MATSTGNVGSFSLEDGRSKNGMLGALVCTGSIAHMAQELAPKMKSDIVSIAHRPRPRLRPLASLFVAEGRNMSFPEKKMTPPLGYPLRR